MLYLSRRDSGKRRRVLRVFLCTALAAAVILSSGCADRWIPGRKLREPHELSQVDTQSPFLKAHMDDGSVYVLSDWSIDEEDESVSGSGRLLDANRREVERGEFSLEVTDAVLFETNVLQKGTATASLSVMTGVSLAVTGFCIANPKACFGSCPTFYAESDGEMLLQAEGFSSSVAPSLERTDVDALYRASPSSPRVEVRMTNEAMETHVVRSATVLAVPRRPGARILATTDGRYREVLEVTEPGSAVGPEGSCASVVSAFDGSERKSSADPRFLGARESVDLEFADVRAGEVGLVVASRQSLMSTYLFYQALAYLGNFAGDWIAALERGDPEMRRRFDSMIGALGGIEVLVERESGEFELVGEVNESGPLATDVVVVPFSHESAGPLKIRLRMTKGLWRLDHLALAALGDAVDPIRVTPSRVECASGVDVDALANLTDPARCLTTYPGDVYTMVYELPGDARDYELFLESRGYYLEWMREEWLAEEDLARAIRMFLDPEGALRELAPEFAEVEAGLEDAFWSSRYAN
jgi:hypothetical protein